MLHLLLERACAVEKAAASFFHQMIGKYSHPFCRKVKRLVQPTSNIPFCRLISMNFEEKERSTKWYLQNGMPQPHLYPDQKVEDNSILRTTPPIYRGICKVDHYALVVAATCYNHTKTLPSGTQQPLVQTCNFLRRLRSMKQNDAIKSSPTVCTVDCFFLRIRFR